MTFKAELDREALIAAVRPSAVISEPKATMAYLSQVRLRATASTLEVTATSLNAWSVVRLGYVDKAKKSTLDLCAPSKEFLAMLGSLPGEKLKMEVDDKNAITLSSGRSRYRIQGAFGRDYPKTPEIAGKPEEVLSGPLRAGIEAAIPFSSTREDSFHTNCVSLLKRDDGLDIYATDGHCAMHVASEATLGLGAKAGEWLIIPRRNAEALVKLLPSSGTVELKRQRHHVELAVGTLRVIFSLADVNPPPINTLIADVLAGASLQAVVGRERLLTAIKQVETVSAESLVFAIEGGGITLEAQSKLKASEFHDEFPCDYTGEKLNFALDPKLVKAAFSVLEDDSVTLGSNGNALSPIAVTGAGGVEIVIMPMRMA